MKRIYNWAIISHQCPTAMFSPRKGEVHVSGKSEGDHRIRTSQVMEILSPDHRKFRTKSNHIYYLEGMPVDWWLEHAGDSGIDDFAPFNVTRFGVVFLAEPTCGRISRQGTDWLWQVRLEDNGEYTGHIVEDRATMVRCVDTEGVTYPTIAEARDAAIRAMEVVEKAAGGKRPMLVGPEGTIAYRVDPS